MDFRMKTTLNIDATVMAELKREAARQGRTMSELVGTALRLLLRSQRERGRLPAAKVGGMDRQTLRDWVIRFNEKGPDGLVNIPSPGVPPKLDNRHKAFLARIVDEGPIPRGRWRGALASLRSHHAIARGVWAFGIGRYGLPRLERIGLLARERQAEALQAGRRRHGRV
jgi:Winged helix-turn helix